MNREEKKNSKPAYLSKFIPDYFYKKYSVWLDCASGDGFMVADYFFKKDRLNPRVREGNYIAIDIDDTKLSRLREAGHTTFCVDLETTDIKEYVPKASLILSIETFEHLTEATAKRLMDDFISILSPGGMILLSFPVAASLDNPVNKHQPDVKYYETYQRYFNSFYKEGWKKSHLLVFKGKK